MRSKNQKSHNSAWWINLTVVAFLLLISAYFTFRRINRKEIEFGDGKTNMLRAQKVNIGGVIRPRSDVFNAKERFVNNTGRENPLESTTDAFGKALGKSPQLGPEVNPQVKQAISAFKNGVGSKITPTVEPLPFDKVAYEANPAEYLSEVEPGRVWQSAQPGPGVPVLRAESSAINRIKQGESVRLKVRTQPNSPVTYTAFDLGAFENRLPSITVAANSEGIAEATFTGTPGTMDWANILASSPMASGRQRFQVFVKVSP
jgi:hypothetical protein